MKNLKHRLEIALIFLKKGQSFKIENLKLGIEKGNIFYVVGWSTKRTIGNISKASALKELEGIEEKFYEFIQISRDLKDFIKNKTLEFNLAFDYGQGSVGICSKKDGIIKWKI